MPGAGGVIWREDDPRKPPFQHSQHSHSPQLTLIPSSLCDFEARCGKGAGQGHGCGHAHVSHSSLPPRPACVLLISALSHGQGLASPPLVCSTPKVWAASHHAIKTQGPHRMDVSFSGVRRGPTQLHPVEPSLPGQRQLPPYSPPRLRGAPGLVPPRLCTLPWPFPAPSGADGQLGSSTSISAHGLCGGPHRTLLAWNPPPSLHAPTLRIPHPGSPVPALQRAEAAQPNPESENKYPQSTGP